MEPQNPVPQQYIDPNHNRPIIISPQVTNTYYYAGFWWRLLAIIIDNFILNIANSFIFLPISTVMSFSLTTSSSFSSSSTLAPGVFAGVFLLSVLGFAINILYFSLFESSNLKATPGKLIVGLIVTDEAGNKVTFGKAFIRNLSKILSSIIFLIGYIMAGFTEKKQALHDIIAGTLVLKRA